MDFVQHVLNGLLQGCILALIGLGFSLVWGILNIINLAHAAFIMLAAYLTYFLWSLAGVDPFISLPVAMLALFLAGYLLQRYVINLVMGASILTTFLLTFGFESLFVNLALRFFSADTRQSRPFYANSSFTVGPLYFPYTQAAASGTLLSTTSGFSPGSFSALNVLAFSVVVLGGLGSIQGALLGGLLFGLVYEFGGTYMLSQRDVIVFAILILVLVFRPTGLLGREGY